jgi:flavin reductase (DIM6/NTAB) family NADH-FMN oxidoreductase RutF
MGISILEEETPMPFIGLFGFRSGRDEDKLAHVVQETGHHGCPLIMDHALACLEGKVVGAKDCGTHTLFITEMVSARMLKQGRPLTYDHYQNVKKGKAPKSAPTYKGDTKT